MTIKRKTKFYWASIAGADPEPVEVCTVEGRRACYTLGCADPFFLDGEACLVRLGTAEDGAVFLSFDQDIKPMQRPRLLRKRAAAYTPPTTYSRDWAHGWRGPR